jgi:V/A-type H+-transporting ATPase subunit I
MFRPKKMTKVRLIVLKSQVEGLVRELHEAGLVDIRKSVYEGLEEGRPMASFDELSAELLKLRTDLAVMESAHPQKPGGEPGLMDGRKALEESRRLEVSRKLRALGHEINELSDSLKSLESDALMLEKVIHFKNVDFSKLSSRTIDYAVGEIPLAKTELLAEALEKTGSHTSMVVEPGFNVVLVIFERKSQAGIEAVLTDAGFMDIDLPEGTTTPMETLNRLNMESSSKNARLKDLRSQVAALSKESIGEVRRLIRSLEVEAERAEIASRFSSSKTLYVIEGWVMEEDLDQLRSITQKRPHVMMEDAGFSHDEVPPTVLDNPGVASPFEFLTKSYSLPNYFELDPTMTYMIGLPILYGMIVGDFLYGVLSLMLALVLMRKFAKSYVMHNVSKIWLYSAFPTMLFGIIFDEWGGMSHEHLINYIGSWFGTQLLSAPLYTGFHRIENVLALVAISALAGMIHLGAGFALGAVNEWHHSKKHSLAKISWIGVEAGLLLALLGAVGLAEPAFTTAGLIVLVISVIALAATEGILGIIELPGLVGNILSYTRIAAIGIVGIVIAELLNEFIIPMPSHGLLALVLLPVFFIFHVFNCFIAMFESLVQGGRLNIVEFRSKFLHGGGDVFIPFALYSKKL